MIDVLLLGLSSFARRRVLPALAELPAVATVHVATRTGTDDAIAAVPKLGRVIRDYAHALDATPPALVYVSLTNDAHARWVEHALDRGHHVVVDKPAFVDLATAERLVGLARERNLVLAEATTYAFHPVIDRIKQIFADHGVEPSHLTAELAPPVPTDGFRYQSRLGGGVVLDMGPYVASLGRVIWGRAPEWIGACVNSRSADDDVETSFSVAARYGAGRAVVGHFAFTTEYRNSITLLGPALSVEAPGAFSTPPGHTAMLTVRHHDVESSVSVPPAFAVARFLDAVIGAIDGGDGRALADALLADARVLDHLRRELRQLP